MVLSHAQEKQFRVSLCISCVKYFSDLRTHTCSQRDPTKARVFNTPKVDRWYMQPPGVSGQVHTWCLIPLIHQALGLITHGGKTQTIAGERWLDWVDAYKRDFIQRRITPDRLKFDGIGYLPIDIQTALFEQGPNDSDFSPSSVGYTIREQLFMFIEEAERVFTDKLVKPNEAKVSDPPPNISTPSTGDRRNAGNDIKLNDLADLSLNSLQRPTPETLAKHRVTWQQIGRAHV